MNTPNKRKHFIVNMARARTHAHVLNDSENGT